MSIGITVDDNLNYYGSIGGSLSAPDIFSGSAKAAGGWILGRQEAASGVLGVDWVSKIGGQNSPSEAELENYLTGGSGALSGGYGPGADVVSTLSTSDPSAAGIELGIYTPQIGGGASYGWFIYDAGSDAPWFWQKYWGVGLP